MLVSTPRSNGAAFIFSQRASLSLSFFANFSCRSLLLFAEHSKAVKGGLCPALVLSISSSKALKTSGGGAGSGARRLLNGTAVVLAVACDGASSGRPGLSASAAAPIPAVALADVAAALPAGARSHAGRYSNVFNGGASTGRRRSWAGQCRRMGPQEATVSVTCSARRQRWPQCCSRGRRPVRPWCGGAHYAGTNADELNVDDGEDIVGEGAYSTVHVGHWLGTKVRSRCHVHRAVPWPRG